MSLIQAIILGIIQGLTEFLPISSSAHLVLIPYIFNWNLSTNGAFIFDVLVQIGTLFAVIFYFRKDLVAINHSFFQGLAKHEPFKDPNSRMAWFIILATLPAVIFGILFKDMVENAFSSPLLVAIMLLFTALLMTIAELLGKKLRTSEQINYIDAIIIGLLQAAAIFPGISRSGATISGGLLRHINRKSAARFSFLLSIPIMAAAGVLALIDLIQLPYLFSFLPAMAVGFITAAVVGYLSIYWLMRFLNKRPLYYFAGYCSMFAIITMVIYYVR